jgi:hypothetical protein
VGFGWSQPVPDVYGALQSKPLMFNHCKSNCTTGVLFRAKATIDIRSASWCMAAAMNLRSQSGAIEFVRRKDRNQFKYWPDRSWR